VSKLDAAQGVDPHFECVNAIETPRVVGEQLDECALASAEGPEFSEEIVHVIFVGFGIVSGKEDSTTLSAVLTAFMGDFALPSEVRGPVESWELARLAASWDSEMGFDPSLRSGL
jgi:hypothetical protein